MTYPALGNPIYGVRNQNGISENYYTFGGNEGALGVLVGDIWVVNNATNDGWKTRRFLQNGTYEEGPDFLFTSLDSSRSEEPINSGKIARTTRYGFVTMSANAGPSVLKLYTVDPVTLAITLQDTQSDTVTGGWQPQGNPCAGVVLTVDDSSSGMTSHESSLYTVTDVGISARMTATLDTSAFTGFDFGFLMPVSTTAYYTNHNRFFALDPTTGAVITQPTTAPDLDTLYINYNTLSVGCVPNYWLLVGGTTDDSIAHITDAGVVDSMVTVGSLVGNPGGLFPGETWYGDALWEQGGVMYVGAHNTDGEVAAVVKDPFGAPIVYVYRGEGGDHYQVWGMTSWGAFINVGTNDSDGNVALRYDLWSPITGPPPPDPMYPCDVQVTENLSTATFLGAPDGLYGDGVIYSPNDVTPDFFFSDYALDPDKPHRIEITFDPSSSHDRGSRRFWLTGVRENHEADDFATIGHGSGFANLYDGGTNTADSVSFLIGPNIAGWNDPTSGVAAGFNRIWFETDALGAVSEVAITKICTVVLPPPPPTPPTAPDKPQPEPPTPEPQARSGSPDVWASDVRISVPKPPNQRGLVSLGGGWAMSISGIVPDITETVHRRLSTPTFAPTNFGQQVTYDDTDLDEPPTDLVVF